VHRSFQEHLDKRRISAGVVIALFVAVSLLAGQAASVRVPWVFV
jgi:hypothetical protein